MPNYTTNYGLHQWEPTDPFLREDFNGDFSAIDAALNRAERKNARSHCSATAPGLLQIVVK